MLIVCFIQANSQTCTSVKELNRKRHKIEGSTYGHPYTTFDRHNGLTFHETIKNIRKNIINELLDSNKSILQKPIYTAYKQLYERAIQSMPSNVENETDNGLITVKTANGNTVEGPSARAFWAKENAFVFLIGLNANGEALTLSQRDVFKYNALQAFDKLNGRMDNIWWTALGTALPILGQSLKETIRYRKVQHYSRSLILWLQAYDLLKASAALPEMALIKWENNYNSDADKSECHPRNKLRKLTRDLYKLSEGNLGVVEHKLGWKKNHGIAAASTLLMAAQVLNDAGVETSYAYELKSIKI